MNECLNPSYEYDLRLHLQCLPHFTHKNLLKNISFYYGKCRKFITDLIPKLTKYLKAACYSLKRGGHIMYGELIIGLNMMFNFTVLSFANKMQNMKISLSRLCFASFVGAVPVVLFSMSIWTMTLTFIGMTLIAYGKAFTYWKRSASIALLGALFAGGLLTALQYQVQSFKGYKMVFLYSMIAYGALYFVKVKWQDVRTVQRVSDLTASSLLSIWEAHIPVKIFVDSGNNCTEPLSGKAVHFVSLHAVEDFIPPALKSFLLSWNPKSIPSTVDFPEEFVKELRLIKLLTVQGESWAIGLKYKEWVIERGEKLEEGYIVLTKDDQRYPEDAQAILHVSAMEKLKQERGTNHVQ